MIDLLILLLRPAVACADDPKRYWYLAPIAVPAWFVDIIIAHTTWALVAGWPKRKEVTVSHTLERLCDHTNSAHPDYFLFCEIGYKINRVTKSNHIKVLAP
jgi:hypothetical protein